MTLTNLFADDDEVTQKLYKHSTLIHFNRQRVSSFFIILVALIFVKIVRQQINAKFSVCRSAIIAEYLRLFYDI